MGRPKKTDNIVKCKCPTCGKEFESKVWRIRTYCSKKCSSGSVEMKKKNSEAVKKAFEEKYGGHPMLTNKETMDKFKKSMIEKYGVDHYSKTPEWKDKVKNTLLEKYGSENYNNKEQMYKTKMERYGDHKYRNDKKRLKTIMDKHGVSHSSLSKQFMETHHDTSYKKFCSGEDRFKNFKPMFSREEYIGILNADGRYKFKCLRCDTESICNISNGLVPLCPKCDKTKSYFQTELYEFIKSLLPGEDIIFDDRNILCGKEIDILIPSKKLGIECDGLFWHGELNGKNRNYHLNKTIAASKKDIRLIHVFEDEWIYKKDIVKSKIQHILGKSSIKNVIYARECQVKEIDAKTKNDFLEKHHIQGKDSGKIKYGLFSKKDNKLVSVMTFGKKRVALGNKTSKDGEYELVRFASCEDVVVGGASKLLTHFIRNNLPTKITTFADVRYSNLSENLYTKLGFKFIEKTSPNYWYYKYKDMIRYHRYGFAKHLLEVKLDTYDSVLSEWDNMKNNGYDRIWDCGNLKYEMFIE